MFFRLESQEFEVYLNSNHVLQVFEVEDQWYVRTTNEEEYPIEIELASKITGKKLERKEVETNAE